MVAKQSPSTTPPPRASTRRWRRSGSTGSSPAAARGAPGCAPCWRQTPPRLMRTRPPRLLLVANAGTDVASRAAGDQRVRFPMPERHSLLWMIPGGAGGERVFAPWAYLCYDVAVDSAPKPPQVVIAAAVPSRAQALACDESIDPPLRPDSGADSASRDARAARAVTVPALLFFLRGSRSDEWKVESKTGIARSPAGANAFLDCAPSDNGREGQ